MGNLLDTISGDVELNPGPGSTDSISISGDLSDDSIIDVSIFERNFSIVHYNIQSLVGKLDLIQTELSYFDVIALSETWISNNVSTDEILFPNYQRPFRKDRTNNSYDGVIIYVKDTIPCKRRSDLEIDRVECVWLEIKLKAKIVLLSVFYRPPNLLHIENSIDLAYDSNIGNIMITGDFNLNYLDDSNKRKLSSLFGEYDLTRLIQEPNHFTENSSSFIDLVFF